MVRRDRTALCALLVALAIGCSRDSQRTTPPPSTGVAEFTSRMNDRVTALVDRCLGDSQVMVQILGGTRAATQRAVEAGRAELDRAGADACLVALEGSRCEALGTLAKLCRAAVRGLVGTGGPCDSDVECAAGTCEPGSDCRWVCTPRLEDGVPCGPMARGRCGMESACFDGACRRLSAAGGPCPCAPGAYCDSSATCRASRTAGACAAHQECAPGYWCHEGQCVPQLAPGQACSPPAAGGDWSACGLGARCDEVTRKCAALVPIGGTCSAHALCASGYCDTFGGGTCASSKPAGSRCSSPLECAPGTFCVMRPGVESVCAPLRRAGEECTFRYECEERSCVSGRCGGLLCAREVQ